ncbi:hypothetical protein PISMIDRAFT_466599 [Pisolithus microcarpus 441]|uniref:Zn(2)-C6 fungal-type domain-containing protein n=1 Tax=Pisolithus microcarpus 441 TaxID=765257 RepID=A0A0C9ZBF6_9AGAM|nr:hypothetical protein BKA83DRAFT_466599 [Pisolithus microcarpus]KIK23279.1 hypothetical protein PISMIDRAFT_466599 [Pisolithus microcarpus 441]
MPPVSTKPKSRRGGRGYDDKHAQETEQKRNTGGRSCAECSRLKIKCDKRIPCQSCQRRGCETLCPNGSLPTGEGTRSIVAATEHLHCQLADKNEQIRQLKDALSKCHARHSTEPHPLLRPGVLEASQGENHVGPPFAEDLATIEHTPELVGTPSISGSGASRFSGPMGGSHCLSMVDNVPSQDFADRPSDITRDFESSGLPREISRFTPAFLSVPGHSTLNVETLINDRLPTWERARYLTKTYLEQAIPLFQSVSKDQISSELLPAYYVDGVPHVTQLGNPHQAGLLFLIFAIAISLDPNYGPGNLEAEAELYHEVVRATICFPSVIAKPSLETIQALHLLSIYNTVSGNELTGKQMSMETSWVLVKLAAHVAHKLEHNRNNDRGGLPAAVTARQKMVFLELSVAYVWNSLEARILPTLSPSYTICGFLGKRRLKEIARICLDRQDSRGSWAFEFVYSCVADVVARTLASDPPSYLDILELDRKVRDLPVTEAAKEFSTAASGTVSEKAADRDIGSTESMYRFVTSNTREILLLCIHWYFFGRVNWVNSCNTPLFSAMYEASLTILHTVKVQYGLHPKLTAGFGFVWTLVFLAVVSSPRLAIIPMFSWWLY